MSRNNQKNINKMKEVNENILNSRMMVKMPSTEIILKENNFKNYLGARRPILWIAHHDYIEIDNLLSDAVSHLDNKMIYEYRAFGSVDFKTKEIQSEVGNLYNMIDTIYDSGMEQHTFLLLKNIDNELKESKNLAY